MKSVQTKQNRALKVLFNKDYLTPTKEMHKDLGLLLVNDIAKSNILKFVYKQRHNETPEAFNEYFIQVNQVHNVNTRQQNNLHITKPNTNFGRKSIKIRGAQLWNSVSKDIRDTKTIKTFSQKFKKTTIAKY